MWSLVQPLYVCSTVLFVVFFYWSWSEHCSYTPCSKPKLLSHSLHTLWFPFWSFGWSFITKRFYGVGLLASHPTLVNIMHFLYIQLLSYIIRHQNSIRFYTAFNSHVSISSTRCSPHFTEKYLYILIIFVIFYTSFIIYNNLHTSCQLLRIEGCHVVSATDPHGR